MPTRAALAQKAEPLRPQVTMQDQPISQIRTDNPAQPETRLKADRRQQNLQAIHRSKYPSNNRHRFAKPSRRCTSRLFARPILPYRWVRESLERLNSSRCRHALSRSSRNIEAIASSFLRTDGLSSWIPRPLRSSTSSTRSHHTSQAPRPLRDACGEARDLLFRNSRGGSILA